MALRPFAGLSISSQVPQNVALIRTVRVSQKVKPMRGVFLVAACASVVTLSSASAQVDYQGAGGCHKGMLWPFHRSAGDCLTDIEKKNGQTGVYGNPNAVLAPAGQPATTAGAAPAAPSGGGGGGGVFGLFGGGSSQPTVATRGLLEDSITPPAIAAGTVNNAATVAVPNRPGALITRSDGNVACTKGWLWPFSRSNGDCLTDQEKKNGQTGVYGNPNAVPATQVVSTGVPAQVAAAPAAAPANGPLITRTTGELACTKGWFWPFYRNDGDCLTDVEKKNGGSGVYGNPNAVPAAAPVVASVAAPQANAAQPYAAPAAVAAVSAADCHKGVFWPFYRSAGDCLTDVEKKNGGTGVYGNPNAVAAPVVASVAAPQANYVPAPQFAAPAAPIAASAAPAAAPLAQTSLACRKGIFWPFYRGPGDCLTDVEKKNGGTGVYGNPNAAPVPAQAMASLAAPPVLTAPAPAGAPVSAPSFVAPAPIVSAEGITPGVGKGAPVMAGIGKGVSCTKGWLWPFYRSAGDCLTDAEVREGQSGVYGNASTVAPVVNAAAPAAPFAAAPAAAPRAEIAPTAAEASATQTEAAQCTKGIFWPFMRKAGDCPTDVERQNAGRRQ
jgi:hypothetical protein